MKIKICDQIVNDILSNINKGILKPKDKLPTNQELAQKYHTSGVTVRKSIAILVNKGYLISLERVGTFVKERERDLFLMNFSLEGNINEEITAVVLEDINLTMHRFKESRKDIKTLEIKTVYYSDSVPMVYAIDALYFNGHYNLEEIEKKAKRGIEKIMKIFNGFEVRKTIDITMKFPNQQISQRLLLDEDTPMLCFDIYYKTMSERPIGKRTIYISGENVDLKGRTYYQS